MIRSIFISLFLLTASFGVEAYSPDTPEDISLAGQWLFKQDREDIGIDQQWYKKVFNDHVLLPGSMTENGIGDDITLETVWTGSIYDSSFYYNPRFEKYRQPDNIKIPFWLTPNKYYVGVAWYQKEVEIPANWQNKNIQLILERAHTETQVWINGEYVGKQNSLATQHAYNLTQHLKPGKHLISVRVDNRLSTINVGPDSHSVTDHTQGNWNGLVGKLALKALDPVYIKHIDIFPDIQNKEARVVLKFINTTTKAFRGNIELLAKSFNSDVNHQTAPLGEEISLGAGEEKTLTLMLKMGDKMQTWDEFHPALYRLSAKLTGNNYQHLKESQFGMREFKIIGKQFIINDRPVFLRGTLHNAESPLTGYPAMDVDSWKRIYETAKAHGLNHVRFHSWCPPEAAFIAADLVGIYLQPEGPSWPNHGVSVGRGEPIDQYLYDETNRMVNQYGNYASFVMLSAGNEPAGNQVAYLTQFIDYWKNKQDKRRVYTGMSVGGSWPVIPNAEFQVRAGARGLPWDKKQPESVTDYREGIAAFNVPFVAHEMGQWCAFPDFREIEKFTGSFRAKNFELFQEDLKDRGMADQAEQFLMASGKLQALCYKHEIERALRTPGYSGFQLLGLQDFPGQGTALVGVLNSFWESKGYITANDFARFSNAIVPLAKFPKFVYENNEQLKVAIELFNSGAHPLTKPVIQWFVRDKGGRVITKGQFNPEKVEIGNGQAIGMIEFSLSEIKEASHLNLEVSVAGTAFANDWDFWVYPKEKPDLPSQAMVYYTDTLNEEAREVLAKGGKVFLNAAGKVEKGKEVVMNFQPVFWNTSWFKMRPPHVTGMYIQYESQAFANFPTSFHSDLQWWEIANRAQVMNLEDFSKDFRPLVQPIDTWFLNRRLALIYEAKVGKGKIIVSSADLGPDIENKPAAKQLFTSLIAYMESDAFNPQEEVSLEAIHSLFTTPSREQFETYTKASPDELKPVNK
jgi:hypothetical protein